MAAVRGSRRAAATLAAGATLLALAWGLRPHAAPPLYDGGPIIAEHYRYLHPSPGFTATKPPSTFDMTLKLEGGQSPGMAETTDENPAQAQLLAAQNTFTVPAGTTAVRVTITPVDPPAVAPPDGELDGNVYRFSITAVPGGAALAFRSGQQVTVVLRGPAGVAGAALELWDGTKWTKLDSSPLGNTAPDSYAANVGAIGDIALVAPPQAASSGGGGGSAGVIVAAVIVAVVMIGAASVLVLRLRRR
ncbi:MAG TPA: hypothetical protein VMU20_05030 [Candidatus Dormibacteraeota bacterium]|nr:hypothetical protein [Candidatus Dormibacteraeota bacterium]